jgi:transposase
MLVQVAHAISRTKNSRLKSFFLRIKAKKGTKVAIVALARKVLCILHHLLVNREMYEETVNLKPKPLKFDRTSSPIQITEQDMIDALVKAGYIIEKRDKGGGGGEDIVLPYHDKNFLLVVKQHVIHRFS